jgi:hypothetical protein
MASPLDRVAVQKCCILEMQHETQKHLGKQNKTSSGKIK